MKPPIFDPAWSEEVKALYAHDLREIWDRTIARYRWNQYHYQLGMFEELVGELAGAGQKNILDVGCAQGTLALRLAEAGHKVVAIDLRQAFLDYAVSRYTHGQIEFICCNALDLKISRQFDVVFANQIIEHLVYPNKLLTGLKALTAPGGVTVVTTPNHSYLKNDLPSFSELGDASRFESKQFTADADGHFFAYTGEELKEVFLQAGYRDVCVRYYETPVISGHMKVRHLHSVIPYEALSWLERRALRLFPARSLRHQLMVYGRA